MLGIIRQMTNLWLGLANKYWHCIGQLVIIKGNNKHNCMNMSNYVHLYTRFFTEPIRLCTNMGKTHVMIIVLSSAGIQQFDFEFSDLYTLI